jgi:hypothetical protein
MADENFARVESEIRRTLVLLGAATDTEARKVLLRKVKDLLDEADRILSAPEEKQPKSTAKGESNEARARREKLYRGT